MVSANPLTRFHRLQMDNGFIETRTLLADDFIYRDLGRATMFSKDEYVTEYHRRYPTPGVDVWTDSIISVITDTDSRASSMCFHSTDPHGNDWAVMSIATWNEYDLLTTLGEIWHRVNP